METLLRPRALVVIENSSPAHVPPPSECESSWKHISVVLAPVVSRLQRKRAAEAAEVQK